MADCAGQRSLFARMGRTMGIEMSDAMKCHGAEFATENDFGLTNTLCITEIWSLLQQKLMSAHMQSQIGCLVKINRFILSLNVYENEVVNYYLSKRFITNATSVWLFSGMYKRMFPQISISMKFFSTFRNCATIRPRVAVNPHMNLKSRMKFAFIKFCVERNHIELP